ncbi:MAG: hypothetical protein H6855_06555 [Rhodospirillales bacterium]|nr:hypothetical protein [Rhodospirillales bacterium]MCB9965724.1 hypothetical protein [Rhodospirillales bacterium]MCB9980073.1 hypothetical protein [Rhodospirillales bacterium]
MGALTPITSLLAGVTATLNTVDRFTNTVQNFGGQDDRRAEKELAAQQDLALQQLQQTQKLEQQQAAQDADLTRQQLALTAQNAEEARQRALKRAVAKQRAAYGGAGISATGGSAEAVLLGLFDESEEDLAQRTRIDQLKSTALTQTLAQQSSLNILQAQQLRERQSLERAVRF